MKKTSALICAGGVAQSFLARMPAVLRSVGPVFSVSLRVARRMANALGAGRAVDDPTALEECESIWIAAPDPQLDRMLPQLRPYLRNQIVLWCDSPRESSFLRPMRAASVTSIGAAQTPFAAEGHPDALRLLRGILAQEHCKLIELHPGSKPLFLAALNLAGRLVLPQFAAAVESLRAAGFSRVEAIRAAESLAIPALLAYSKGGRKAWTPSSAFPAAVQDACVGELYRSSVEQALRYFGSH